MIHLLHLLQVNLRATALVLLAQLANLRAELLEKIRYHQILPFQKLKQSLLSMC